MPQATCRNKALDLLSRRPHFRRELTSKLARKGYEEEEIEPALDRLEEELLLDDAKTARDFVDSRLAREPIGRYKLLADLARHGASRDVAQDAVDAAYPVDDRELAAAAAERWSRRSGRATPEALGRHLERRGFSRRAIVTILQDSAQTYIEDCS